MNIHLSGMTLELCHALFREFTNDISVFPENRAFSEYHYSEESVNAYWKKNRSDDRIHLAILKDNVIIREIILKKINWIQMHCTLSIHMKNDSVKNQGYGTEAERQVLAYAKEKLEMKTIYANAFIHNKRSQHVLEKVGFKRTTQDQQYVYYKFETSLAKGQHP